MATFLLGVWIAGCIVMAAVSILTLRAPTIVMSVPHPAVDKITHQLGWEETSMLLRHAASEQSRFLLKRWEMAQVAIGAALGACLFLGTQRRVLPLLLCVIMLVMVLFQLGVNTELAYRGKETDFPPGSTAIGPTTRYLLLQQVFIGAEIMKLIAGVILTSFLFVFRTGRRRGNQIHAIDHPDHSHVDG
jgi:hypothetical protein